MAASALHLDFGHTGPTPGLPSVSALWLKRDLILEQPLPENGGFEALLSHPAPDVRCQESLASPGEEGISAEGLQDLSWHEFFSGPTQWWDNRRSKKTRRHADISYKDSNDALWLNNRHQRAWLESPRPIWNSVIKRPPELVCTSVQGASGRLAAHEDDREVQMCRKVCEDGRIADAVDALNLMVERGFYVPSDFFYRVLKRCIKDPCKDLGLGRRIHALTVKSGYEGHAFLATHLIGLYSSHGRLEEAMRVFDKVSTPDVYNWATIILAHARHGEPKQAIRLYRQMRESAVKPNNHIFLAVLKACATARDLTAGKDVHAHVLASAGKPDIFVQTCLVDMYAKCGSIEDARKVFEMLPHRNVVTWTAMIAGYSQQGMGQDALALYRRMQQDGITPPDSVTFVCLLQACASVGDGALHQGKQLHAQIEELGLQDDVVLGASLVNMYAKCGSIDDARRVFSSLPDRNVVTWNAMIAGYAQQGMLQDALRVYSNMQQECTTPPNPVTFLCLLQACASAGYAQQEMGQEALNLYRSMEQDGITPPDSVTFVCLLQACASVGEAALHQGKQLDARIEEHGLQDDVVVGGSLVNMYAKCGSLEDARRVFDRLPHRNVVSWTAMIACYAQQGMALEALSLYRSMQLEGMAPPNAVTFVCLLQACASVAALPLGKQLHAQIKEQGLQADEGVGKALVNMYAKCGSMVDSQQAFDSLPERDIVAWGALIAGYTRLGDNRVVFDLVDKMTREGVEPDSVTFLNVLTVCSHASLVEKGQKYFEEMRTRYGISPNIDHFTCMIDIWGRAGHLDEALQMAKSMPFPPNFAVWITLLAACRKWNNLEIGRQAFEFAVSLDEKDASSYVLMSNIYAGAKMWGEAEEMQAMRVKSKAWKQPGHSWWTDMGGVVHTFIVGDKKHPESEGIYARLEHLVPKMKKAGYVPHLNSSLKDIPDDEKEAELCGHSEKLAIAYALNKTPEGTTIRVMKNLRVCVDCHRATAYISKVEKRTIICRDASRFHVFTEGKCSCGDYW